MAAHRRSQEIELPFKIDGEVGTGSARFEWSPAEPAELHAQFYFSPYTTNWIFARELLRLGLDAALWAGEADVRIRSNDWSTTRIRLTSPEGTADLIIGTAPLRVFLNAIDSVIPSSSGDESQAITESVEAAIERILEST